MHERIRFTTHQGKQVLIVDVAHCSAEVVEETVRAVPEVVATRPRGSILILSDFTGASFNDEAVRAMKEAAVFDKPYIKKSAWVGEEHLPSTLPKEMRDFSRREFQAFANRDQALEWLVKD